MSQTPSTVHDTISTKKECSRKKINFDHNFSIRVSRYMRIPAYIILLVGASIFATEYVRHCKSKPHATTSLQPPLEGTLAYRLVSLRESSKEKELYPFTACLSALSALILQGDQNVEDVYVERLRIWGIQEIDGPPSVKSQCFSYGYAVTEMIYLETSCSALLTGCVTYKGERQCFKRGQKTKDTLRGPSLVEWIA